MITEGYSWREFLDDARHLVNQIRASGQKVNYVYGIPRGGLVLAVYLSHTLDVQLLTGEYAAETLPSRTLVCDDNTITGTSIAPYTEADCLTAVLIHGVAADYTPSWHGRRSAYWPIFPWEEDSAVNVAERGVAL